MNVDREICVSCPILKANHLVPCSEGAYKECLEFHRTIQVKCKSCDQVFSTIPKESRVVLDRSNRIIGLDACPECIKIERMNDKKIEDIEEENLDD